MSDVEKHEDYETGDFERHEVGKRIPLYRHELEELTEIELDCTDEMKDELGSVNHQMQPEESLFDVVPFCSVWNVAFVLHYLIGSCVFNFVGGLHYAELMGVLGTPPNKYYNYVSIMSSMWGIRAFVGFLSDNIPIQGYCRKPYIATGWVVTSISFLILFTFYSEPTENLSEDCKLLDSLCGNDVSSMVTPFVIGCILANLGIAISTACMDAFVVENDNNGSLIIVSHALWLCGSTLGRLTVAIGLNDKRHLGFFTTFHVPLNIFFIVLFAISVLMIFVSIFLCKAEQPVPFRVQCCNVCCCKNNKSSYDDRIRSSCTALKQSILLLLQCKNFHLVLFCFLSAIWTNIESPVDIAVRWKWAGVQQLQQQAFAIGCLMCMALGIAFAKTCILNTHWRRAAVVILVICTFLKLCIELSACSIKGTDQYVYLTTDFLEAIPQGLLVLLVSLSAAAISPPRHEAMVYNMLVSFQFLPIPLARIGINTLTDYLPMFVSADSSRYGSLGDYDNYTLPVTTNFRLKVMFSFMTVAFIKVLILPMTFLLPESYEVAQLQSTITQFSKKKLIFKAMFVSFFIAACVVLPILHAVL